MTTVPQVKTVTLTIDGVQVTVPEGTLVIRAAEEAGIQVPRFCDHPLLDPVGACRQCLVDIPDAGNGRGFPKPQASCTIPVAEGMVVATSNPTAVKAQQGIMEFLLVNHPLDCPVCDKGGECPLQNQAMSNGRTETRFDGVKRTFPKPIPVSANILLDRERCVLCARCTRFADQVPGDPSLVLIERGARQQVGTAEGVPFSSYFSGNVIQICPVGALTSAEYRFRARPFDLVSTPSVAEHDACGAAIRVDHRRGKVMRRLAGDDPEVNQEWISDKDRFGFRYATQERLSYPQIREDTSTGSARRGELRPASWLEAFAVAARGLAGLRAGVLPGGRLTLEEARAYADFAAQLGAPVDFRSRPHSAEEATFLRSYRASVTYADLEAAGTVVLVGLEPEDEAGTIFLRLREAVRKHGVRVVSVAPFTTYGASKLSATLVRTAPGEEAAALGGLSLGVGDVILAGERLALSPGALAAAAALAERTGAKLAWVPRRAGEMGAIEAGLLPAEGALDGDGIIAAAASGELEALVVGGVDPADTSDPAAFLAALEAARFVVSLEQRPTAVTALADVVLPVAAVVEKSGTFVTWDGRHRTFGHVLQNPNALPDARVLAEILAARPATSGEQSPTAAVPDRSPQSEAPVGTVHGRFKLATWKLMLDHGTLQQGDKGLAATARPAVARLSPNVFATFGPTVTIRGDRGEWTLPAEPADLADDVVWVPANSFGGGVLADLASPGSTVEISTASTDEELA